MIYDPAPFSRSLSRNHSIFIDNRSKCMFYIPFQVDASHWNLVRRICISKLIESPQSTFKFFAQQYNISLDLLLCSKLMKIWKQFFRMPAADFVLFWFCFYAKSLKMVTCLQNTLSTFGKQQPSLKKIVESISWSFYGKVRLTSYWKWS